MQVIAPDGVFLVALQRPVLKGETVDVPEDVAASLIEQGWQPARTAAPKSKARTQVPTEPPAAAEQED